MTLYATIDCGTTNSRVYIVDDQGIIYGKATKTVGVKDTAITGSRTTLQNGIHDLILEALKQAGKSSRDLTAILSSGMITSEIGLVELPHLVAPCSVDDLANNIVKVDDINIVDENIPIYFVRGIKNKIASEIKSATELVGEADFMRGEETQIAGMLSRPAFSLPAVIVILSSHTKFIPIDKGGLVLGSLTTMSGQLYEAIINNTFVGKSVNKGNNTEEEPKDYFDQMIVDHAINWIRKVGLVRTLMFPRFLDVLFHTTWYERHLFFEALIAAEDMLAIGQLDLFGNNLPSTFILVGTDERCRLYRHMLRKQFSQSNLLAITKIDEIDDLSIQGILTIARKAGIVK